MKNALSQQQAEKLLIVSHVVHYHYQQRLYAYTPYTLEIDQWASLFHEVIIASPLLEESPPDSCSQFKSENIIISPVFLRGNSLWGKINLIFQLPQTIWRLIKLIRTVDAVHVRCPGNLGLMGVVLAPIFKKKVIAKYAGQWSDYPGEAYTYRLQKKILNSKWFHGPVLIYGSYPGQPAHIVSFFTSMMSDRQMAFARLSTQQIRFHNPTQILFVGRLSKAKNVHILIEALARLKLQGYDFFCNVLGDGPEFENLLELSETLSVGDKISFHGAVSFEDVLTFYGNSDVLVLVSETEGWPKAIAEAMAYGLICIGSNRGLVPYMLSGRGVLVSPGDGKQLTRALEDIISKPSDYLGLRKKAALWAQEFTLDGFRRSLKEVIEAHWNTKLVDDIH